MIANIGGNTFLIIMGFDIVATIFCYIFVQETRGKNLEHAAGTEWEVAERLAETAGADEKGQAELSVDRKEDAIVVDEKTGKALWEKPLNAPVEGIPAVYEVGGREYVVFCAAGTAPGAYVAFALPAE